jgi:hypothetical protein
MKNFQHLVQSSHYGLLTYVYKNRIPVNFFFKFFMLTEFNKKYENL